MSTSIQFASGLYKALQRGIPFSQLLLPSSPYLALCGDVATTDCKTSIEFLRWCSDNYEKVWWIPGWFEMGGYNAGERFMIHQLDALYRLVRQNDLLNIYIGNKTEIELENMMVYSTPLYMVPPNKTYCSELYNYSQRVLTYTHVMSGLPVQAPIGTVQLENIYKSEYNWILKKAELHKLQGETKPIVVLSGSMTHLLGSVYSPNNIYRLDKKTPIALNLHGADFRSGNLSNVSGYAEDNVWYGVNDYRYHNYDPMRVVQVHLRKERRDEMK